MSERLRGVVEAVEAANTDDNGAALAVRTARVKAVASSGSSWGEHQFGPHDLCRLGKKWRGVGIASRAYRQGFYHLLSGLDASVEGACAYFRQLHNAVEPIGWLSMTAGTWALEEAEFCFYAAFSQVDVRLRVRAPGTVTTFAIGADGTTMGCSEDLWLEARLCSMLRSLELVRLGPAQVLRGWETPACLRTWTPLPHRGGPAAEAEFLSLAARFYGRSAASAPPGRWGAAAASPLCDALTSYFCDAARHAEGAAFFGRLGEQDPAALIHQANCLAIGGDDAAAGVALKQALNGARQLAHEALPAVAARLKQDTELTDAEKQERRGRAAEEADDRLAVCLGGWARYHLRHENLQLALGCAVYAIEHGGGGDVEAWLLLARVLLAGEEYALAMLALNNAPVDDGFTDDEPNGRSAAVGMDPSLTAARVTEAAGVQENLATTELRTIADERDSAQGVGAATLAGLAAPQLGASKRRAYTLLVEMLHSLGWETLLELRADVFLVDGEESSESEFETESEIDSEEDERDLQELVSIVKDDGRGVGNVDGSSEGGGGEEGDDDSGGSSDSDIEAGRANDEEESDEDGYDVDDERSGDERASKPRCSNEPSRSERRQTDEVREESASSSVAAHRDEPASMVGYYRLDADEPQLCGWYSSLVQQRSSKRYKVEMNKDWERDAGEEGPELASIDQLEELLAAHGPQTQTSGPLPSKGRRQYSSPWLEQLFQCLHQDLVALTEWLATADLSAKKAAESTDEMDDLMKKAYELTHGDGDPESVQQSASAGGDNTDRLSQGSALAAQKNAYYRNTDGKKSSASAAEIHRAAAEKLAFAKSPSQGQLASEQEPALRERTRSRPTADWLRLGELAERLDSLDDAVRAYTHAVESLPTSYIALRRLLLLYTTCGRLAEALVSADELCRYLDDQSPTAVVVACVAQLLDEHGPDEVRLVMQEQLGSCHPAVGSAIIDAVARVSGIPRGEEGVGEGHCI